jgi:predicted phosphate transport protein (TIGR00153 family)
MASPLGKLFGRSPIAPIQMHMQLAQETVQMLCSVLSACADDDFARATELLTLIDGTVAEARQKRREIRQHLPRGLMLAMPRPDLLELLNIQARVADHARACALPLVVREMSIPKPLVKPLDTHASLLAAAADEALTAIRDLDEMLTQGFGQHERKIMEKMLAALDRRLARTATQRRALLTTLSKTEGTLSPLDAMFFYQLFEQFAHLARACADVGEQLELLIAR